MQQPQLIFNGYMVERAVVYFDIAFLAPARKFFPNVRGSNWYYNKYDTDYCIPDGYANMFCEKAPNGGDVGHGAVVGGDRFGYSVAAFYSKMATRVLDSMIPLSVC